MNADMNTLEDKKWQSLLKISAPTFAGDTEPPYGLVTQTLARLKAENREQEAFERIGWRALLASLAALAIAVTVTLSVDFTPRGNEFEPGVKSLIQMDNISIS